MNSRPVVLRTSESAEDFWSRVRDGERPGFRIQDNASALTPFGRQQRPIMPPPFHPRTADASNRLANRPLATSREIERRVLQDALRDAENIRPADALHLGEIRKLKADVARLHKQLCIALKINHVLTGEMARNARDGSV